MTSDQERREGLPDANLGADRVEYRIFAFADHAVVAPDGKMYMNGAGVEQVFLSAFPGNLPPLFVAVRVHVPWHMISEQLELRLRALNSDRQPIGPDPIATAQVEVGRAPGARAGDELAFNLAIPLAGLPVQTERTVFFHLEMARQLLGVLPLKIGRLQMPQSALFSGQQP